MSGVAQVYRSVDANGRISYSDQPATAGAASAARRKATATADALLGEWVVASVTMDGRAVMDDKFIGALWTFKGSQLTLTTRQGKSQAYLLKIEPASFTFSPVMPSKERGGTMIYERTAERLRVAFFDGAEGRPPDFQPRPKQIVAVLARKSAAVGPGYATAGPGRDSCALLRKAGAQEVAGAAWPADPKTVESSTSAVSCRIEGSMARIDLLLIPASSSELLLGERAKEVRDMPHWALKGTVEDEPALGAGAFVVKRGNSTVFMALKGDTALRIGFVYPPRTSPAHGRADAARDVEPLREAPPLRVPVTASGGRECREGTAVAKDKRAASAALHRAGQAGAQRLHRQHHKPLPRPVPVAALVRQPRALDQSATKSGGSADCRA